MSERSLPRTVLLLAVHLWVRALGHTTLCIMYDVSTEDTLLGRPDAEDWVGTARLTPHRKGAP